MATVARTEHLTELASFLAQANEQKARHIGYLGTDLKEIGRVLEEDFIEENDTLSFVIERNEEGEMIAAIGLDIEDDAAEVWGPFSESREVTIDLWHLLQQTYPHVHHFQFFINVENKAQQHFVHDIGAKKTGTHLVLTVGRKQLKKKKHVHLQPFKEADFEQFKMIHNSAFPNTYYDAEKIVSRISDDRKLYVLKDEQTVLGYGYFEVGRALNGASLEYIAIAEHAQNQGYGTALLSSVLEEIFTYPEIQDLTLCVSDTNARANHVYEKVGFQKKYELFSYVYSTKKA